MAKPRYRAPEVPGGTTYEALAWLSAEKQRAIVTAWIRANFDRREPDHILFDERDTWNVFDEVYDEFDGVIPDEVIEHAIETLEGEWVRRNTARRGQVEHYDVNRLGELYDHVRSAKAVHLGTARELQERVALNQAIKALSEQIEEIRKHVGMHGHNGGPADLDSPTGQFAAIAGNLTKLDSALQAQSPDLASATQIVFSIEGVARENGWLEAEIKEGMRAYIKAFCEASGKGHAHLLTGLLCTFVLLVYQVLNQYVSWLEVVAP